MSGVIQRETSVAAGAVNDNLVSGSAFELARRRCLVTIGCIASATGAFATIQGGPDIIAEEFPPYVIAAAGNFPLIPDHMYYNSVLMPSDRLVIRFRNPTGGAITARIVVQVQDLE